MMLRSIIIRHCLGGIGTYDGVWSVLEVVEGVTDCGPRHNKEEAGCKCGWRPRIELDDYGKRV